MSVRIGKVGQEPNWIRENDWSSKQRLDWIHRIMAFSPRDWSFTKHSAVTVGVDCPESETWAMWCLACCDTKEEALESWYGFCEQYGRAR